MKKLIIFDLDGTLAESKSQVDEEMLGLLADLLEKKDVAIISGGAYSQFEKQLLKDLKCEEERLKKLHIFPTSGASLYRFSGSWNCFYEEVLTENEKAIIKEALEIALPLGGYTRPDSAYGEILEDRGTQISFSALGQLAPIHLKKVWDPDGEKRFRIKKFLDPLLSDFSVRVGGATTIDITKKGIDKAYGIKQMEKHLGFAKDEMLFMGDAIIPGGNDYPVKEAGVDCVHVSGPHHTKEEIRKILFQI